MPISFDRSFAGGSGDGRDRGTSPRWLHRADRAITAFTGRDVVRACKREGFTFERRILVPIEVMIDTYMDILR